MSSRSGYDEHIRLSPRGKGTIFVFNTIAQGMFADFKQEVDLLVEDLKREDISLDPQFFVAFGPFDNIVRIDVDDFSLVNRISSLHGVNAQQIQCAYALWNSNGPEDRGLLWKPFCCITQLKIQNHLMLGCGPEIEEAVAQLLVKVLKEYLAETKEKLEIEVMASLGWEEYHIFMRNARGYEKLFRPVVEKIRGLTLEDLEPILLEKGMEVDKSTGISLKEKHLFLTTFTTPAYCLKLANYLEEQFVKLLDDVGQPSSLCRKNLDIDGLFRENRNLPDEFGEDELSISTRLSIKPGHLTEVREAIFQVLDITGPDKKRRCDDLFCVGRYDVYLWLDERMTCKVFVALFELLRFFLGGCLGRMGQYRDFLNKARYYNSFTIISLINVQEKEAESGYNEGAFIGQLGKICLGKGERGTITETFKQRPLLKEKVPNSIVIGLTRIFSLFDSCIMDRFICDSFIDMYPFMQRLRDIIDTLEEEKNEPGIFSFTASNAGVNGQKEKILLQEARQRYFQWPLVKVFHEAIQHFYRGYMNRYLSSYPMMDKNETGIDFSGRLHRILSATTGMQNLLLDDLNCHLKKGFNVIGTYPHIRIHRGSFNISESNVFHLFQPEIFYSIYHEIMHTFIHSNSLKYLRMKLNELIKMAPDDLPPHRSEDTSVLIQEIVGDVFLLKNSFYKDFSLYSFWYWLLLLQSKKDIDSHIILRFLLLSAVADPHSRDVIFQFSSEKKYFVARDPQASIRVLERLISCLAYPSPIKEEIMHRIKSYDEEFLDETLRYHLFMSFSILLPAIESIYPLLDETLEKFSYPAAPGADGDELNQALPLAPSCTSLGPPGNMTGRQFSSIRLLRGILTFIYKNREHLECKGDGVLNFSPQEPGLRLQLFRLRIALINTLQWEVLRWKKTLLEKEGITFPIRINKKGDR